MCGKENKNKNVYIHKLRFCAINRLAVEYSYFFVIFRSWTRICF